MSRVEGGQYISRRRFMRDGAFAAVSTGAVIWAAVDQKQREQDVNHVIQKTVPHPIPQDDANAATQYIANAHKALDSLGEQGTLGAITTFINPRDLQNAYTNVNTAKDQQETISNIHDESNNSFRGGAELGGELLGGLTLICSAASIVGRVGAKKSAERAAAGKN